MLWPFFIFYFFACKLCIIILKVSNRFLWDTLQVNLLPCKRIFQKIIKFYEKNAKTFSKNFQKILKIFCFLLARRQPPVFFTRFKSRTGQCSVNSVNPADWQQQDSTNHAIKKALKKDAQKNILMMIFQGTDVKMQRFSEQQLWV